VKYFEEIVKMSSKTQMSSYEAADIIRERRKLQL